MILTRRTFIASLTAALVAPRLALPQPAPGMVASVAPELVAFHQMTDNSSGVWVTYRLAFFGENARAMLAREPHLWSAVMVDRKVA
jgi:hypothetical protein